MKLLILNKELSFLYNSQRDKTIMASKLPHLPATKSTNAPVSWHTDASAWSTISHLKTGSQENPLLVPTSIPCGTKSQNYLTCNSPFKHSNLTLPHSPSTRMLLTQSMEQTLLHIHPCPLPLNPVFATHSLDNSSHFFSSFSGLSSKSSFYSISKRDLPY